MFYPISISSSSSLSRDQLNENQSVKTSNSSLTASRTARTSLVCYGPIRIRRRHTVSSTLATGRRSKDDLVVGEDPIKRELRRMKNRDAARRLKAERDAIERDLTKQVDDLEEVERTLLNEIDQLKLYKRRLEDQYDQCLSYYEELLRRSAAQAYLRERETNPYYSSSLHNIQTKEEPRAPSSPQWQLLFHI